MEKRDKEEREKRREGGKRGWMGGKGRGPLNI